MEGCGPSQPLLNNGTDEAVPSKEGVLEGCGGVTGGQFAITVRGSVLLCRDRDRSPKG